MSEVAEKAAEVVAENVEEAIDGVVEVVEVIHNNTGLLIGVAVAGLVAGGVGGYFIAKKQLRSYYEDLASQEIAEAKEFYATLNKVDVDGAVLTPMEVMDKLHGSEAAATALRGYQGEALTPTPSSAKTAAQIEAESALLDDEMDEAQIRKMESRVEVRETVNVFVDPTFDYEEEVKHRTPDKPYIITHDEFFEADNEFDNISLTYFEDDDSLIDEQDKPVADITLIGEDHLARFGHGSKDKNIVYVRNEKLKVDYEICLSHGSWLESLGLGPEPDSLKHSDQRDKRRAFRNGDG